MAMARQELSFFFLVPARICKYSVSPDTDLCNFFLWSLLMFPLAEHHTAGMGDVFSGFIVDFVRMKLCCSQRGVYEKCRKQGMNGGIGTSQGGFSSFSKIFVLFSKFLDGCCSFLFSVLIVIKIF